MFARLVAALRRAKRLFREMEGVSYWARDEVVAQKHLMLSYQRLRADEHLSFRQVGFGLYSQHDEDGILLYIFSRIGVHTYRAVEMCAGTGYECNVANLLINHRWTGLLFDGNPGNISRARAFYQRRPETRHWAPNILQAWITRGNVNQLLIDAGYAGEVDLLSLDVDGVDYWLWEAMTAINPRVVVLEYNHLHGPEASVTVPYRDDFVAEFTEYGSDYAGASFIKLGRRKGYRYIGSNAIGTNAFFVRDDVPDSLLPEAAPHDAFVHPRVHFGMEVRYLKIKDKDWVEV
jgi:hypothetical protein